MNKKDPVVAQAKKYIGYINDIIEELNASNGTMNQERKNVLTKKVIKYKAKIEQLKTIHAARRT